MSRSEKIKNNSDSLIELLTAQCTDLEELLSLARQETEAAKNGNFLGILDVVSERAKIGEKLETFQRQITELRSNLEQPIPTKVSERVIELSNLTLYQDKATTKLLTTANEETSKELIGLEKAERTTNAYITPKRKGLAFDRDI